MKIAFISNNNHFAKPIINELKKHHEVSIYLPPKRVDFNRFGKLLSWADVAYYEWCDQLLQFGTAVRPDILTVARLHRFEVHTPVMELVEWDKVDLLINNNASDHILEKFKKRVMKLPKKMKVMPDGVDLEKFKFVEREFKPPWQLCMVGTIVPRKGVYEAIRLFADLDCEDSILNIVGKGSAEYIDNCAELVDALDLNKQVNFLGPMPQNKLAEWLGTQHIIISNSREEGNHTVIKEAMATGCFPVINCWLGTEATYPVNCIFKTSFSFELLFSEWLIAEDKLARSKGMRAFVERKYDAKKSAKKIRLEMEKLYKE